MKSTRRSQYTTLKAMKSATFMYRRNFKMKSKFDSAST